jgi:hypothetical protein
MQGTIELSDEKVAAYQAQAASGLTIEQWIEQLFDRYTQPGSIAHLQRTNPKEWARQFREWADGHDRSTPLLSDEAISRESIYPDRI